MPRRDGPVVPLESLTPEERRAADDGTHQLHWYALAARLGAEGGCQNALDVGTGWGLGLDVLREAGLACCGLDPVQRRPARRAVGRRPLRLHRRALGAGARLDGNDAGVSARVAAPGGRAALGVAEVVSDSYDLVVACDVLEHDDLGLLRHMLRVARRAVFVSTPNWLFSRGANPHYVREYTPDELLDRVVASGCSGWCGWTAGPERQPERLAGLAEARHNFGVWLRVHPRPVPV